MTAVQSTNSKCKIILFLDQVRGELRWGEVWIAEKKNRELAEIVYLILSCNIGVNAANWYTLTADTCSNPCFSMTSVCNYGYRNLRENGDIYLDARNSIKNDSRYSGMIHDGLHVTSNEGMGMSLHTKGLVRRQTGQNVRFPRNNHGWRETRLFQL